MKFLLFLSLLFFFSNGFSMTCQRQEIEKIYNDFGFVFSGKVVERVKEKGEPGLCWSEGEACGTKIATIEIFDSWKGNLPTLVEVESDDACNCLGTYFNVGDQYVIFANKDMDSTKLIDAGACATESLSEMIVLEKLLTLNTLSKKNIDYIDNEILGLWESPDQAKDIPFEGTSKIKYRFENNNLMKEIHINEYGSSGVFLGTYFISSKNLVIKIEDNSLTFEYQIKDDELLFQYDFEGEHKSFILKKK